MKSPKIKGVGEVVTDYGAKVMKVFKEGLLGRSLFDFYGDVKALTFKTKEVTTVPKTPADGKGGVMYTKSADGKLYYKSNEVSEIELTSNNITGNAGTATKIASITNSDIVQLGGTQTITGAKTFTNVVALTGTGRITGIDTVSSSTDATSKTYVDTAVAGLIDSAPSNLNTLNELSAAMNDSANFFETVVTLSGNQTVAGVKNFTSNVGIGTTSPASSLDVRGTPSSKGLLATLFGTQSLGATIQYHRGSSYSWMTGIGASNASSSGIPVSFFGISELGNTARLVVAHTTGNVGIGTTSPESKLHIIDSSSSTQLRLNQNGNNDAVLGSGSNFFQIKTGSGGNSTGLVILHSNQNVGIGTTSPSAKLEVSDNNTIKTAIHIDNTSTGGHRWDIASIGSGVSGRVGNLQIRNDSDSSNVVEITGSGNVGIGTESPAAKLHINNSGSSSTSVRFDAGATASAITAYGNGGNKYFELGEVGSTDPGRMSLYNSGNQTILLRTDGSSFFNGGNVGIGTTSPTHLLTLETDSSPGIKIKDTTQGATLLAFSQDANSHIGTYSSHPLVLDTNSAERMRITSAGKVGIGTATPGRKLTIAGSDNLMFLDSTGNSYLTIDRSASNRRSALIFSTAGDGTSNIPNNINWAMGSADSDEVGDGTGFFIDIDTNAASPKFFIERAGNVGIGTASPASKLHVTGTVQVGVNDTGHDVIFYGATSGKKMQWDESADTLIVDGDLDLNGNSNISGKLVLPQTSTTIGTAYLANASLLIGSEDTGIGIDNNEIVANGNVLNISTIGNTNIQFRTAATEVLTLSSSQNVGIGVNSPSRKLHIDQTSTSAGGAYIYSNAVHTGTTTNSLVSIRQDHASSSGTVLDVRGDGTGDKLIVWDTAVAALIVKDGGNVGIGTASPSAKLDVNGEVQCNSLDVDGVADISGNLTTHGDIIIDNSSGDPFLQLKTGAQNYVIRIDQSDSEKFQIRNTTAGVTALSIDTSQNATFSGTIGSGAITSTGKITGTELEGTSLDINGVADINAGSANIAVELASSDAGCYIRYKDGADSNRWYQGVNNGNYDVYNNGNTAILRLDSSNNATFVGRVMSNTHFQSSDSNATLSATGTGNIFLRPNGYATTSGQVLIETSGNATFAGNIDVGAKYVGRDSTDRVDFSVNNQITFRANNTSRVTIDAAQMFPDTTNAYNLGHPDKRWNDLYFGDGSIINFNADVTLTHSSNALTIAGGQLTVSGEVEATSLDINGAADISGDLTTGGDVNISKNSGATLNINTSTGANDSKILLHEGTTSSIGAGASIRYDGANNLFKIGVGTSVDTTRLTIDRGTGNVGIGTTSPAATLHAYKAGTSGSQTIVAVIGSNSLRPVLVFSEGTGGAINNGMSIEYDGRGAGVANKMIINGVDGAAKFTVTSGGDGTFVGDLTVSGGDITLGGTGRIQGIDTVSADTDAANKTYVDTSLANLVDSAPGTLNTLNELAAALGDDASFSTTVTNSIATKLPLAGGTMSGAIAMGNQNITGGGTITGTTLTGTSLDINGAADISGNLTVGDSHVIGDDSDDNLLIQSSANENIIIDSADDIILDADGGDVIFRDGGTEFGRITNSSGNLIIKNNTADKDVIFQADNSASGVETYFFLDGSAGGTNPITIFPDNSFLKFGTGQDLSIAHDGSHSYISNNSGGHLYIQQNLDDKDIVFQCDNGSGGTTAYLTLDGSAGHTTVQKQMVFADNVKAFFGTGSDLSIDFDGTNGQILQAAGDLYITNSANDKDIIFQSDNGSGGVTAYLTLDGSNTNMAVAKTMVFADSIKASFGASEDLKIKHDGSNSSISHDGTGDLHIINSVDDSKIRFYNDNGSGGTIEYMRIDGSSVETIFSKQARWTDNVKAKFGGSGDLEIYHDGSNSYISDTGTGDLYIQASDDLILGNPSGEVFIQCNDNSSVELKFNNATKLYTQSTGATVNGTLSTTSNVTVGANATFVDNGKAIFGAGSDLSVVHDGSNSIIAHSGTGNLFIRQATDDGDIILQSDDGNGGVTAYFSLDGSLVNGSSILGATRFPDKSRIVLGSEASQGDLNIYHDATDSFVNNFTGDLYIRNNANDKDIVFQSDNGSGGTETYFFVDGSLGVTRFMNSIFAGDDVQIRLGNGNDLKLYHDATNSIIENGAGNLIIRNNTDDGDIVFQSDNGSGGVATYFYLDGSLVNGSSVLGAARFPDKSNIYMGTGGDLLISHDGANSFITNATGDLTIASTGDDLILKAADDVDILVQGGEVAAKFGGNGGVDLYHNNVKKFETTSAGATVTGTILANGLDLDDGANANPLLTFKQDGTRRAFIQFADNFGGYTNNLRLASEFGAISLLAASSNGSDSDTAYLVVEPTGVFKFGAIDSDAVLTTDGSMTFRIDADNDETSQKFAFQNNASTEVANIDESGNAVFTGKLTATGIATADEDSSAFELFDADGDPYLNLASKISSGDMVLGIGDVGEAGNGARLVIDDANVKTDIFGDLNVTGIVTGKQRQSYNNNFLDDLGTTKHFIPFQSQSEQTSLFQEEVASLMPSDGRIVSVSVRVSSVIASGNMTIGVNTIAPNGNPFASSNWTEEETEVLAVSSDDDYHVFHFAFSNTKHFDSGDLVSISIQNSADLSVNQFWYVTTVVEYNWNTFLGTTSAEFDSNP